MDPEERENDDNGLNPEGNLFEILANGSDYDDDDDNEPLIEPEISFEDFSNEKDDDDDEDDDENNPLFEKDNEEEEEDNDENDDEELTAKEIEVFNKKLGTDFKTVEDFKKMLKTQDQDDSEKKEEVEYQTLQTRIGLFDQYIGMNNETLIRNQLISEAIKEKLDVNDPDVIKEIDEKIEGLNDLGQIDSYANTLRSNLQTQKEKTLNAIEKIENRRTESANAVAQKNIDDLQNALTDIYVKKEFMGVTVTKEDMREVYEDIRTEKFFKRINGNQEMIAKVAMFLKKEEELQKLGKRPTHSDNTKTAFETLANSGPRTRRSITQANGSASSGNANDNLTNFLK